MRITQSVILTTALAITVSSAPAAIIFSDDFNGDASDLDGASPDVGTGNWVASNVFNRDGSIDPSPGSATLAFTPLNGNIYQLDASLSGVSGDGNWFALGYGSGQSIVSSAGNRFINNLLIGKSWMLFRGNDDGHQAFRGNATSGTFDGSPWTALGTVTGAIDLRIELDTTGGTGAWATTWFAKLPTDGAYTEVRPTEVLADESINSVGLALANVGIDGNVDSFSLTSIPEPSSIAMLGLGVLALAGRRRKS